MKVCIYSCEEGHSGIEGLHLGLAHIYFDIIPTFHACNYYYKLVNMEMLKWDLFDSVCYRLGQAIATRDSGPMRSTLPPASW